MKFPLGVFYFERVVNGFFHVVQAWARASNVVGALRIDRFKSARGCKLVESGVSCWHLDDTHIMRLTLLLLALFWMSIVVYQSTLRTHFASRLL